MQYYNCIDNIAANELVKGLRKKRLEAFMRHQSKSKHCTQLLKDLNNQNVIPTVSVTVQQWINDSCCAQVFMNKCLLCKKRDFIEKAGESICSIPLKEIDEVCLEKDVFSVSSKLTNNEYELCCKSNSEEIISNKDITRYDNSTMYIKYKKTVFLSLSFF